MVSDIFEALLFIVGDTSLEQHRVGPKLSVSEGQVAVRSAQQVHAAVTFREVACIGGEGLGAARATEGPSRGYLEGVGGVRGERIGFGGSPRNGRSI